MFLFYKNKKKKYKPHPFYILQYVIKTPSYTTPINTL
jgi:hypothetical protein